MAKMNGSTLWNLPWMKMESWCSCPSASRRTFPSGSPIQAVVLSTSPRSCALLHFFEFSLLLKFFIHSRRDPPAIRYSRFILVVTNEDLVSKLSCPSCSKDKKDSSQSMSSRMTPMSHHSHSFETNRRGHFVVPIYLGHHTFDASQPDQVFTSYLEADDLPSTSPLLESELLKLHKRFGHPSLERFLAFLKSARSTPPSAVALPLGSDFNDVIAIDIMHVEGKPVLKIVCMFSRYVIFVVLKNQTSAAVIQALDDHWRPWGSRS